MQKWALHAPMKDYSTAMEYILFKGSKTIKNYFLKKLYSQNERISWTQCWAINSNKAACTVHPLTDFGTRQSWAALFRDACLGVNYEDKSLAHKSWAKSGEQLPHRGEDAVTREGHSWVSTHHVPFLDVYDYSLHIYNLILNMYLQFIIFVY